MATAKTITPSSLVAKWKAPGTVDSLRKWLDKRGVKPVFQAATGRGITYYYSEADVLPLKSAYLNRKNAAAEQAQPEHAGKTNIMSWQKMIALATEINHKLDNIVPSALNNTLVALVQKVEALETEVKRLNDTWGVAPQPTESGKADDE